MDPINLRIKYPVFEYRNFIVTSSDISTTIVYQFAIPPDITFSSKVVIPIGFTEKLSEFETFVFHLGLIEAISYWKTTCSPNIEIKCGSLNEEQTEWWKNLLIQGMGEYFYKNQIDYTKPDFVTIFSSGPERSITPTINSGNGYLIPVGGGKDSAVTLETFSQNNLPFGIFLLNPTEAAMKMAKMYPDHQIHTVTRTMDTQLFELIEKGFLNGHTPYSAYLAFCGMLTAYIGGYSTVVLSNERSSDEPTTYYLGKPVNHQFTKSFVFEKDFSSYCQKYLTSDITYFSFLRPLYELQIAKIFSKYEKFFPIFKSCNKGAKQGIWCGKCPKCLSTYILLYPFIDKEKMTKIFGHDFYDDESLLAIIKSLIEKDMVRPFECVGTREEMEIALWKAVDLNKQTQMPVLLDQMKNTFVNSNEWDTKYNQFFKNWGDEESIPGNLLKIVRNSYE